MLHPIRYTALIAFVLAGCEAGEIKKEPNPVSAPAATTAPLGTTAVPADARLAPELQDRTARVELSDGRILHVRHNADGTARLWDDDGLNLAGRWFVSGEWLCFDWRGRDRECWPYPEPAQPGVAVTSRSDRGQEIRTTLLEPGEN